MAEVVWQRGVMSPSFCLDQSTWLAYPRHVGREGGTKEQHAYKHRDLGTSRTTHAVPYDRP